MNPPTDRSGDASGWGLPKTVMEPGEYDRWEVVVRREMRSSRYPLFKKLAMLLGFEVVTAQQIIRRRGV